MILAERPEHQMLICVARRSLDVGATEKLRRLLRGDLDWTYLLAMADRHGLIPLLHKHLGSLGQAVPAEVLSRLRDLDQENTSTSLLLTGELIKLLDFLAARGIQAIPFKGPVLGLLAYGDLALRQFTDLDILVKRQDVSVVKRLLAGQGFAPRPGLNKSQESALLRFDCSHNFANEANVYVDLHWDIAPRCFSFGLDPDRLWDRLQPLALNGRRLMTLSVEDLLLILCLHGFMHFWDRLGWICDVAGLIELQENIDWDLLVDNSIRRGNRRVLSLGLFLARELLDAPIPPEVWSRAPADATVTRIAEQVRDQLFAQSHNGGIVEEARLHLSMRERKRDKLKAFFRLVATPRASDWQFASLPAWLFFLYYPLRPLRLAAKCVAGFMNGTRARLSHHSHQVK
jgi:hypothetical protein